MLMVIMCHRLVLQVRIITLAEPITITDNVAKKVYELVCEEQNFNLKLRIYIVGGGCAGFQYGFAFVETPEEADIKLDKTIEVDDKTVTLTFLVDSFSLMYLKGATVDYKEDVKGSNFIIKNPNAKTTCGCGESFS